MNIVTLALIGVGLSVDSLAASITTGACSCKIKVNIWLAMLVIGIATFVFSSMGVVLGKKIGKKINQGIEVAGGIVLIGLGLKILIEHMYF